MNRNRNGDAEFGILVLLLLFGPAIAAILTGNWMWLLAYILVALVFGL